MLDDYYQMRITFQSGSELFNLKIHRAEEKANDDWLERPLARPVPILYVHAKPIVIEHRPILGVTLLTHRTAEGAVGKVGNVQLPDRVVELEIGQAQAWIYPEARTALLWEAYFADVYRTEERQIALWQAFEDFLSRQSEIRTFYTPGWDPDFEEELFQKLLTRLGYTPAERRFYKKEAPPAAL